MKKSDRAKHKSVADDGRTVADMNLPGTPWYSDREKEDYACKQKETISLTKAELWSAIAGMVLAVLTVGLVLIGAYLLFILFCTNIWLR